MDNKARSFIWGGGAGLAIITLSLISAIRSSDFSSLAFWIVVGVLSFTLISCLILNNNFVGEMLLEIFSWGFVRMPGLIFTLDLDGIIWLLTVKLLFWILGIVLAILCGALAIVLGLVVSLFVYPFALYKSINDPD